jgi:hypothetical protein
MKRRSVRSYQREIRLLRDFLANVEWVQRTSNGASSSCADTICKEANRAKGKLTDEEFIAVCSDVIEWLGRRLMEAAR